MNIELPAKNNSFSSVLDFKLDKKNQKFYLFPLFEINNVQMYFLGKELHNY